MSVVERTTGLGSEIRKAIAQLCSTLPADYWRTLDAQQAYPEAFVDSLARDGWLGILIPTEYGGGGLGIREASIVLEEVNHQGGNAAACHAQMYVMAAILRHGTSEQKSRYLPEIASGRLRLQAFAVTEPDAGSDTTAISTKAVPVDGGYRLSGRKIFTSRVQHSDLMLVLARTGEREQQRRTTGLTLFLIDLRSPGDGAIKVRPIQTMINHETNEVLFEDLFLPRPSVVGEVGRGFHHLLDGLNAERILIAAECIGDSRWFIERSVKYACERVVFDRPIGRNQGVQYPIAQAYVSTEAADMMRYHAAELFDGGRPCGAESNMAKLLASQASWSAANVAMDVHGGYGMTTEYDVERKFRENRLYQVAPVTNNLVLSYVAEHVLNLPRSV
ncbi:MAG TPA: acyl-CoA dehydrogenase family protein [Candidatus Sulfotelmatobacter sp.]|nr:acyl-CoA dehydrogenase family protein [Candidatus Sulfotelmatobacter sp.]